MSVQISDHLPVFEFVGGEIEEEGTGGGHAEKGRWVNESRIRIFAKELGAWSFVVVRAMGAQVNVTRFRELILGHV